MPGPDRGALAAVRHAQEAQRRAVRPVPGRLGPGLDELGGPVGAAVVDDEDLDRVRQPAGAGRTVAGRLAAAVEVAEQLVERRADPLRLVVGRQDDREARRAGRLTSRAV